jgi:Xaa-Pro aminopeptidase
MQEAIYREKAGGWLFSSLQHRDFLSESILELNNSSKNTRPWFYVVYPEGSPTKILHGIEPDALSELPGEPLYYQSRETLVNIFRSNIFPRAPVLACQFSPSLPVISTLDHGTCLFLEECGFRLISAASLIQRFRGLLTPSMIESHERAAVHLREIVDGAWALISRHLTSKKSLREGTVQHFILEEFRKRGLITSSPPLVAVGANTANPHYTPGGKGESIVPEEVVQLDLWAKENSPDAVYADISWV